MFRRNYKPFHIAVNSTIEGKVCHLRVYTGILAVIHFYKKCIFLCKNVCYIYTESRITTVMYNHFGSIKHHFCTGIHSMKL